MDMSAAYASEVRAHCPNVEIVYDLFHVIARYGHDVIDRVRVDEANRLRDEKPARKVVKAARRLLSRSREGIEKEQDCVRLNELLAANQALMTVYVLKEDLKLLWRQPSLIRFARNLTPFIPSIIANATWRLNTSVLEGISNRIKVIKRMAYGFRDDAYFVLKIRDGILG
jgi:transposase